MEYFERAQWIETCKMFFDAYVDFYINGTEAHWYKCNNRNVEIAFLDCGYFVKVQLFCPEALRSLNGYYGKSEKNTEEIIRMLYWLVWEAEKKHIYVIKEESPEEEYQQLGKILAENYRLCYDAYWEEEYWKETGEERLIINLHGREIEVHFSTNAFWDRDGYIDVDICSLDTGRRCSTFVQQKVSDPEGIIRIIQDMALEPDTISFSITDSEWEHDLLKESLVGGQTESGDFIARFPFQLFNRLEKCIKEEHRFYLHQREVIIRINPHGDYTDIIIDCPTTERSYAFDLPKQSDGYKIEEISEEVIRRIQELAWEAV